MPLIIIADDDELVVGVVRAALEARGHVVGELNDGKPVKRVVELKHPDVVILDCTMADVSGIMALKEIRDSTEAFATPVLMLTGRRNDQDVQLAYFAGCNDYLKKPCEPEEVVYRVQRLLEKFPPVVAPMRRVAPGSFGRRAPGR